jgi:membrane fusion protein (multidrug efflux system)
MVRWLNVSSRLALVAAVGAAATAASCRSAESPAAANTPPAVIDIGRENVVTVKSDEISVGPLISGDLRAQHEATVRAELSGSVLQAAPEEGQTVKRGAVLARIEARPQEDALRSAESMIRSADEGLAVADRELARTERLVQSGALAERELEAARNTAVAARAQRDDAQARFASARKALADATVTAPMAGVVARRHVNRGDVVSPGTELYTIIDPSSMRLEASVPSEQLGAISVGATVNFEVRGYPDQSFAGTIERISPMADPTTRQVPIFVTIPNTQGRLVAGLFAEGRVVQEVRHALVVPVNAINERGGAPWVLRVKDGKTEKITVTLGLRDTQTERVEIASGVAEGDVLLVGAAQGMTPGTPVKIRAAAPAGAGD